MQSAKSTIEYLKKIKLSKRQAAKDKMKHKGYPKEISTPRGLPVTTLVYPRPGADVLMDAIRLQEKLQCIQCEDEIQMDIFVRPPLESARWGPLEKGGGHFILVDNGITNLSVHCGNCKSVSFWQYFIPEGVINEKIGYPRYVSFNYIGDATIIYAPCPGRRVYALIIVDREEQMISPIDINNSLCHGHPIAIDYLFCEAYPDGITITKGFSCPCHGVYRAYALKMKRRSQRHPRARTTVYYLEYWYSQEQAA
ncbi:hypothetical protein QAD02_007052 [Eretmocerus hayati]|uniref:Uncharacterized protein n=1 Tax=Eretmocerus hayati TaxID=131215 RepID=A0ACC2N2J3_9HYME|nr:hypothetical protein QAD02_007052 [Eretmocerus hayati]